jgi:hypothetical protein
MQLGKLQVTDGRRGNSAALAQAALPRVNLFSLFSRAMGLSRNQQLTFQEMTFFERLSARRMR